MDASRIFAVFLLMMGVLGGVLVYVSHRPLSAAQRQPTPAKPVQSPPRAAPAQPVPVPPEAASEPASEPAQTPDLPQP